MALLGHELDCKYIYIYIKTYIYIYIPTFIYIYIYIYTDIGWLNTCTEYVKCIIKLFLIIFSLFKMKIIKIKWNVAWMLLYGPRYMLQCCYSIAAIKHCMPQSPISFAITAQNRWELRDV